MSKRKGISTYRLQAVKLVHYLLSIALFFVFFLLFRYGSFSKIYRYNFRYNYYVTLGYAVLLLFFDRSYNAYLLGYYRIRSLVFGQILSQVFSLLIVYLIVLFAWGFYINPLVFLPLLILQFGLDCVWSYFGNLFFYKLHGKRRTLLIYRSQVDRLRFGSIKGKPTERMFDITDEIQFNGSFDKLKDRLKGYDTVFVAGVNSTCRNGILKYCKEENITGYFLPHVGDTIMQSAIHVKAFDSPILYVGKKELDPEYAIIKRAFDIVSSGLALIILSPIIAIIAFAIYL